MTKAEKATIFSGLGSLFLVCWQIFMATISGSIALWADAWHSGTDVIASAFVWMGIRLNIVVENSTEKIKKIIVVVENIIACIIGCLIIFTAYTIFKKAYYGETLVVKYLWLVIPGTVVSIIVAFVVATYKIRVGTETNTYNLLADGLHSWSDMFSSCVVLIGLISRYTKANFENAAAFVVSVMILKNGIDVIFQGVRGIIKKQKIDIGSEAWTTILKRKIESIPGAGPVFRKLFHVIYPGNLLENTNIREFPSKVFVFFKVYKRRILKLAFIAGIAGYLFITCFYVIKPDCRAFVTRFGKCVRSDIKPGFLVKLPFPFEKIIHTNPDSVHRIEIGYRKRESKTGEIYEKRTNVWESGHTGLETRYPDEAITLTGDEYILDVSLVVHFKVKNMYQYYFRISNAGNLVRYMTMDISREFVGTSRLANILTDERGKLEKQIMVKLQECLDTLKAGIKISLVCLKDVHPPVEVVPSFREVASAVEERAMMINQAEGYENYEIPVARGMADKYICNAEMEKILNINLAAGEAQNFTERVREYKKAPRVTATRLYLERMENLLENSEKIIVPEKEKSMINFKQLILFRKFLESNIIPSNQSVKMKER
ncbi:MAG: FtsH protease activity modulator HflK [bacterium]